MCKAAPASGSRREMCTSLNSLGAAPLHRRCLHRCTGARLPSPAEATNAAAEEALPASATMNHSSASSPPKRFMVALRPTSAFNYFTSMNTNHRNGCCTNVTVASAQWVTDIRQLSSHHCRGRHTFRDTSAGTQQQKKVFFLINEITGFRKVSNSRCLHMKAQQDLQTLLLL